MSLEICYELQDIKEGDRLENEGEMKETVDIARRTKSNTLLMAVDPDVKEYITKTAFQDQLNSSLAKKKGVITWKPNQKTAAIEYHGESGSDSWKSDCFEEVQNFVDKFAKCDVPVNKDFWEAVVAQGSLGFDPSLIKISGNTHSLRIVCLKTDVKSNQEKVKAKLEEIYLNEILKTKTKIKIQNVPKERLILLKKLKFVENLKEKNRKIEISLDVENEELRFKGPQQQLNEAIVEFRDHMNDMVEKSLKLSVKLKEILGSKVGLQTVNGELEKHNVQAVIYINKGARVVGTSTAHVDNALEVVNRLMLEEKVHVEEESQILLQSHTWHLLCQEINTQSTVHVHGNSWNDVYLVGFRENVSHEMKKLQTFLEKNRIIMKDQFQCRAKIIKKYLVDICHEDLRCIEVHLKEFQVEIKTGNTDNFLEISGTETGLKIAREKIDDLQKNIVWKRWKVEQPGLCRYFEGGKENYLMMSVKKKQACTISIQKSFMQTDENELKTVDYDSSAANTNHEDDEDDCKGAEDEDDDDSNGDNNANEGEAGSSFADNSPVLTKHGHKISWKIGNIEAEKVTVVLTIFFIFEYVL